MLYDNSSDSNHKIEGRKMSKLAYVRDTIRRVVRMQILDCRTSSSRDSADKKYKEFKANGSLLLKSKV